MSDVPFVNLLSPEHSQISLIMENATDDPAVVISNKENASSAIAGDGVENVEGNEEDAPFCVKKRKLTFEVWSEFKVVTLPDKTQKVECIHCKAHLAFVKGGTTTHYRRHLKAYVRRKVKLS